MRFDVVAARAESYERPGALPEVRPGTLEEDLARRDFTVNAIAVGLHASQLGQLRAHPGALDDLDARTLRVLHGITEMGEQRRRAKAARQKGGDDANLDAYREVVEQFGTTTFVGYTDDVADARILAVLRRPPRARRLAGASAASPR